MTRDERKVYMKLLKNGIHYDIERLREFIKMVDETTKNIQRERARKVMSVYRR